MKNLTSTLSAIAFLVLFPALQARACNVQPDILDQLVQARENLNQGSWDRAAAHADLILLERPVAISPDFEQVDPRSRKNCERALAEACDTWSRSLNQEVRFVVAAPGERTDLVVRFEPDVSDHGVPVAGYVNWLRSVHQDFGLMAEANLQATLQIRTRFPRGGRIGYRTMKQAIEHELGHVMGLDDANCGIMGPVNPRRPIDAPTQDELASLLSLRAQADAVRSQAALGMATQLTGL